MFRTVSSVIASRICVWLATVMLVFPFIPTSPCHCSGEGAVEPCCETDLQHDDKPAIDRGCCAVPKQQATANCCANSLQSAAPIDDPPCGCGPTCRCHLTRHSEPRPAVPTTPSRNGTEQVQCIALTLAATLAATGEADTPLVAGPCGEPLCETALDRCITLSRFLC